MKAQKGDDFLVEANGHCFFCLAKIIIPPFEDVKVETSTPTPCSSSSRSIKSLQCLSRYLKVDMRKVFHEKDYVPPHLLAKVEQARLKVELCADCSHLTESFSKLYRALEKVEMGMANFVNQIQRKLEDADETGKAEKVLSVEGSDFNSADVGLRGRMDVMKVLRKEVVNKCIDKLGTAKPTVRILRLTRNQIESKRSKIKSESRKSSRANRWGQLETKSQNILEPRFEAGPTIEDDDDVSDNDYASEDLGGGHLHDPDQNEDSNQPYDPESSGLTMNSLSTRQSTTGHGSLDEKFQCSLNPATGKYRCKLCGKEFVQRGSCRQHFNTSHAMIKYKCNLCGKEFSQLSAYRRHLRTTHLGVRFKCQVCNKTFKQSFYLAAHLKFSDNCRTVVTSKVD